MRRRDTQSITQWRDVLKRMNFEEWETIQPRVIPGLSFSIG